MRGSSQQALQRMDLTLPVGSGSMRRLIERDLVEIRPDRAGNAHARGHDLLGVEAGEGCIVLVDTVDQHMVGSCAGGLGEGFAPQQVVGVEYAGPVHHAEHDGFGGTQQNQAKTFQGILDSFDLADPATAAGVTLGRGRVETECAYRKWARNQVSRTQRTEGPIGGAEGGCLEESAAGEGGGS